MKPSTVAKLIAFFALYDAALAAPAASSGTSLTGTETTTTSAFDGNPSSLRLSQTTTSTGAGPTNTDLTNTEFGSRYATEGGLGPSLADNFDPSGSGQEAICRHGRLFNVQQACVDHCAGGTCYDSMWTPPVSYTAYEYSFHAGAGAGTGPARHRGGDQEQHPHTSNAEKRAAPTNNPQNHPNGHADITQYQMQVAAKKPMQIWVCGTCPSDAGQGPWSSRAASTSTVTPITTSATTTVPGRSPGPTGTGTETTGTGTRTTGTGTRTTGTGTGTETGTTTGTETTGTGTLTTRAEPTDA